MKLNFSIVFASAVGVILAGAALYHFGKLPVLSEARKGFDGRAT